MKYLLLVVLLPFVVVAQSREQRKAQEKADRALVTDLKLHVQNLLNLQHTADENALPEYIGAQFKNAGLSTEGDGSYIKKFTAQEGKYINSNTTVFVVNDTPLVLYKDYFPLAFSGNATAEGSASISMREQGSPWFLDVKDMLDDNKNNNAYNIAAAIKKQAAQIEGRKASALIVYNSSEANDNISFNKTDSLASVHVPVVYLSDAARKKYFKDATDFYDVKLTTALNSRLTNAQNIIGYINNNAPATVIVHAVFKHYKPYELMKENNAVSAVPDVIATASLIELAGIIKKANLKNNNYLFIASPLRDSSFAGLDYWLEQHNTNNSFNYMMDVCEKPTTADAKTYTVTGYNNSFAWHDIITTADKNKQTVFDSSSKSDMQLLLQKKNIPALIVAVQAPAESAALNYDDEKDAINFLARLIIQADEKGKIPFVDEQGAH